MEKDKILLKEGQTIENDIEYFDNYFDICLMLQERCLILDKLNTFKKQYKGLGAKEAESKQGREEAIEKITFYEQRLIEITTAIRDKESVFWDKVNAASFNGMNFVLEVLSCGMGLGRFEKRVIVYLMYLYYIEGATSAVSLQSLLRLFDLGESGANRISSMAYFNQDKALLKNNILRVSHSAFRDEVAQYYINPNFVHFIAQCFEGSNIAWEEYRRSIDDKKSDSWRIKEADFSLSDVCIYKADKDNLLFFLDSYQQSLDKEYGVKETFKKGLGLTFLFHGASGTGKSMLAEAIGHYLGKKVMVADYADISSCWLGDTEKNIVGLFKKAANEDCVLIIDEADSLLRSRQKAEQRWEFSQLNQMLVEIEKFNGVLVLTTNMAECLDPALERRIALKIAFKVPDEQARLAIWSSHIPKEISLAHDVDLASLAKKYGFSGGNIKNAVLNALRKAMNDKRKILYMSDLLLGAELENQGEFINKERFRKVKGFSMDGLDV